MVDRKETTVSTTLAPAATNDMDDLKHDPSHIEDVVIARLTDEDLFNLSRESLSFNSKASFRIFLLMVVQGINQAGYGVDWSVIGGLNAFDTWHEYFHFATAGEKFATMNALMNAGGMCGAPFLTFADHIGRRGMNFVGNAIVIVAAILQAFANDLPMFMAGRFLLGFGSSLMSSPQYIAEVAPAHLRGRLVGIFGACFQVGSIVMTGAMLAFVDMDKAKNDWCWRIPLLLEAVCPAIVCITIFFLTPESPRFLIMRGKTEKARRVIAQYQTDSGDVNAPLVDHVFAQIEESLENDRVMNRQWWNFLVFFTRPVRYRFMLLVLYSFFQSWNGGGIISTYLRPALETVGISDTKDILGINLGLVVVYAVFTLVGALIIDHVNRRTLIFSGLISFILLQTAATVTGYK
jgi:MFS family permease